MNIKWEYEINECGILYMLFEKNEQIIGECFTLSEWLTDDVNCRIDVLNSIDDILSGKVKENMLWGNAFKAYIYPDYSEIHSIFEDDEDVDIKSCKLPTKLLRKIVATWLEEFEKYRNSKK